MYLVIQVQALDEAVCILLHNNAFGKGINPSVLHLTQKRVNSQAVWLLLLCKATSLGEGKLITNKLYSV